MGRPTKYTEAIATYICDKISQGITLSEICRENDMPCRRTVGQWRQDDEEFYARFARARDLGFDAIAEDALAIADDGSNDWMERNKEGSKAYELNGEHVQRSKLRIETRLKLLAKWDPKRYGERLAVENSGTVRNINMNTDLSPDEIKKISDALEKEF